MSSLFTDLAGISDDTFKIGEAVFMAAPVTLDEYAEFQTVQQGAGPELYAWLADKLRRRVKGVKTDPATITAEWVTANLSLPKLGVLQHVLLYGEMPKATDEKKP